MRRTLLMIYKDFSVHMTRHTNHLLIILIFLFFLAGCKYSVFCTDSGIQLGKVMVSSSSFQATIVINAPLVEHEYEGRSGSEYQKIAFSNDITEIPVWAFAIISSLEEVKLNSRVRVIHDNAFFGCKNLKEVNLNNVEDVGENSFKFTAVERLKLENVKCIRDFAFANCAHLQYVEMSEKIDFIGDFAFSKDTALVECSIPSGRIGVGAFMDCPKLEKVSLGQITFIGKDAFLDCSSLQSIEIPSSVDEIEEEAFLGCKNLKEVIVHNSNTKIAINAFEKSTTIKYKQKKCIKDYE